MSESVTQNELNRLQADHNLPPIFTKLATKAESQEVWLPIVFWWKSDLFLSAKPELELIITLHLWKNIFNVKYLENGERCDVGLKGGQIGNHQRAFDSIRLNFDPG